MSAQTDLSSAFLEWAAREQRNLRSERFKVSLMLGSPTKLRSARFEIAEFEIQPDGWVTDNLKTVGEIGVWENGCVDAQVETDQTLQQNSGPKYFEHWRDADPTKFDEMFETFLANFSAVSTGRTA